MNRYSESELTTKLMAQIQHKLTACLFMLCEDAMHLSSDEMWVIPYDTPPGLKNIQNDILTHIKKLNQYLSMSPEDRDKKIHEILGLNKALIQMGESIYCYFSLSNMLQEILVHYQRLLLVSKEKEVPLDIHGFYHDCLDFVQQSEDKNEQKNNMAQLMKAFPFKMTREKYYDYIQEGFLYLAEDSNSLFLEDLVKTLKFRFMPTKLQGYGQYYTEIKDKLDTILHLDYSVLSDEDLKELYGDLDETLVIVQDISDFLSTLHECTNYLVLILTFSKDIDYLTGSKIEHRDIFYTTVERIFSEDGGVFDENLFQLIDRESEAIVDLIISGEKDQAFEHAIKHSSDFSEDTINIINIYQIITNGYYESFEDMVYPLRILEEDTSAGKEEIKEKAGELIGYIKNSLSDFEPAKQRLLKKLFLDSIPSPLNLTDFSNYIQYILDTANDFTQKLIILDSAGAVFESTGFADLIEKSSEPHEHVHGPDCGHDHHH